MSISPLIAAPLVEFSLENLKKQTQELISNGVKPSMKVILVGSNPASMIYTRNKKRFCEKFGALCEIINIAEDISANEFILEVKKVANDDTVHGCFVQLPLPKQLAKINIGELIPPNKDVDGFSSENINSLFMGDTGDNSLLPCTPKGIISLLKFNNIPISGKNITIIGRSHIVGRPLALLFTNHDATVTLCHSRTKDLSSHTKAADIIVSAVGIPRFFTKDFLNDKADQILIDVGINHDDQGKLCGDMDFDNIKDHVKGITPVPGGIGPLTILCLAENLIQAAKLSIKIGINKMDSTKKTSLYDQHVNLKAKLAPFAGFHMPLQYTSVKEEVLAVRNKSGIFDVSHMGEFFCTGKDAIKFVDYLITNDFLNVQMNKAIYSPLCREDGTVIDDLIAYKLGKEKVLICVNASNIEKDWNWIQSKIDNFDCELSNQSHLYSLLAIQGPETQKFLSKINLIDESIDFPYYQAIESRFNNEDIIIARTGYTGEDGFEIFTSHKTANLLWEKAIENNIAPCGLAARDVLRLEVCYPLYGHELTDEYTPLDCALRWTVKFDKKDFIGKEVLEKSTPKMRLIKLSLEKGIPREGYKVLNENDEEIGHITSGTMSVVTGKGIALALIEKEKFPENKKFKIQIRKNNIDALFHTKAFITGGHK